jgi:SAM-dependent methyltransferase
MLAERLRSMGHSVVGVDRVKREGVGARVDQFVEADIERGLPAEVGDRFDAVIAVDVLGHVRDPEDLLRDCARRLRPGGTIFVSVPNFGHWYPRARVATGKFDYDSRGILDREHLRFFTRPGALRCFTAAGLKVARSMPIGLPLGLLARRSSGKAGAGRVTRAAKAVDQLGVRVRPSLFAYQFLFELRPTSA